MRAAFLPRAKSPGNFEILIYICFPQGTGCNKQQGWPAHHHRPPETGRGKTQVHLRGFFRARRPDFLRASAFGCTDEQLPNDIVDHPKTWLKRVPKLVSIQNDQWRMLCFRNQKCTFWRLLHIVKKSQDRRSLKEQTVKRRPPSLSSLEDSSGSLSDGASL